ncbi:MAG: DUF6064 family protein [Pseudomonadota bacterium]
MDVWLDYSLSDFLLFSPETYWRLFEQLNSAIWPFQIVVLAALVAVVALCLLGWSRAGLAVGVSLALCWVLVGSIFFEDYYAPINWVISSIVPLVWLQAALLLLLAPRLDYGPPRRINVLVLAVVVLTLAYPLLSIMDGRPIAQAEMAGFAPDPTAFLTIGLIGLAQPGWPRAALSVLPCLWLMFSTATLFALHSSSLSAFVMVGMAIALLLSATRLGTRWSDLRRGGL